jgi:hypothetical protein
VTQNISIKIDTTKEFKRETGVGQYPPDHYVPDNKEYNAGDSREVSVIALPKLCCTNCTNFQAYKSVLDLR